MLLRPGLLSIVTAICTAATALAEEPGVIASMDAPRFQSPKEKGRSEIVEGKVGKATRFQLDNASSTTFFTSNIHGTADWDRAAGFSFWVKGNGSRGLGGLEFIYDDDYAVRYDLAFPFVANEWTKVSVAWQDLIPVLPGPRSKPLGRPAATNPRRSLACGGAGGGTGVIIRRLTSPSTRFASSRR